MKFIYSQTDGGTFDSRPTVAEIREFLRGEFNAQDYYDRGHGEYVNNVEAAADFCRQNKIDPDELIFVSSLDVE